MIHVVRDRLRNTLDAQRRTVSLLVLFCLTTLWSTSSRAADPVDSTAATTKRTLLKGDGPAVKSDGPIMDISPKSIRLTMDSTSWVMTRVNVLNRGTAALQLAEISTSCGCASGTVLKNPIQPMDVGEILIRINVENLRDSINVIEYSVQSNATNAPYRFKVFVRNPAVLSK